MSDMHDPQPPLPPRDEPLPPLVIPVRYPPPPPPPPRTAPSTSGIGTLFRAGLVMFLALSLGLNLLMLIALFGGGGLSEDGGVQVTKHFHSGDSKALNEVAIVKVEGVIMEGATAFALKQLDAAAADPNVKAVVVRINSPGGSITASDDLHRHIKQLADGTHPQQKGGKKTVVVSMGAIAASGGYYIAMPGEYLFAEPTTITGSIGVYASFPNVEGLAKQYGFKMNTIKAGEVKDSGSMFKEMTPDEKQMWQDMIDRAFDQFLTVVDDGRKGKLKKPLREPFDPNKDRKPGPGEDPTKERIAYKRRLADGGIWTGPEAESYGLVDKVGYQDDAVKKAGELAGLSGSYKVITYERPASLANLLLGAKADAPAAQVDASKLSSAATPRLWMLAPQSELAGFLSAIR